MPSYSFDHIHMASPDPLQTAAFYEKVFGAERLTVTELTKGRLIVKLNLNGVTMLISKPRDEKTPVGLWHFGIRTDNLEKAVAELKDKGADFTQGITEMRPGLKISFLQAPDNVGIEVQEGGI